MADSRPTFLRWQSFFQRAAEPLFLLNRQRRILFVNTAWEALTGLAAAQARGLVCTRRAPAEPGPWDVLAGALAPPPEVLDGQFGRARRLVPAAADARHVWDIEYLPLRDDRGLLCILGKVAAVTVERAAQTALLPEPLVALRAQVAGRYGLDQLAGQVPALRRVADQVRLARQTRSPVLIVGEPGTGKQWLARTIHHQGTGGGTFAALDCTGLPPQALAPVLFGDGGLARQEAAGMLYLKEPSRLPRDLQARLCDLLAAASAPAATAGPRVAAGCCADPDQEVRAGRLLEELSCALGTLVIHMPPVRERQADLPGLVDRLLDRANAAGEGRVTGLTPAAWDVVRAYPWPGNLRELYGVLAAARARAGGERIDAADLPAYLRLAVSLERTPAPAPARSLPLDQILEQAERRLIVLALRLARGNKSRAADLLAIWRPRLHRRMEALGIADAHAQAGTAETTAEAEVAEDSSPAEE
ncbi:MAG TPA: sigma 54-interacting transcriptional regulator [Gemmataceae bacterium]|jgi:DNA-binding NtrC family response regulator|nr:sigma 54-interacting transcriptional regulator [Gemmataceae bacterium]